MTRWHYLAALLLSSAFCGTASARTERHDYAELAYVHTDPDQAFEDGHGQALFLRWQPAADWFVFASYTHALVRTEPHMNITKRSLARFNGIPPSELTAWQELGAAWTRELNTDHRIYAGASYQGHRFDHEPRHGYGLHLGLESWLSASLQARLELNHSENYINDRGLYGELTWWAGKHCGISLRTRDQDEWDYSTYELGLRIAF